jgi:hypothetical protein
MTWEQWGVIALVLVAVWALLVVAFYYLIDRRGE